MEDQLKETVSTFLKLDASSINSNTVISRSALGNSILLHRMYAKFLQQGFDVHNYNTIETFGDLLSRLNGKHGFVKDLPENETSQVNGVRKVSGASSNNFAAQPALGIDIESLNNFESADDYREHPFYKSNFSQKEISFRSAALHYRCHPHCTF